MRINYAQFDEKTREIVSKAYSLTKSCEYAAIEPPVVFVALYMSEKKQIDTVLTRVGIDPNKFCGMFNGLCASIPHRPNQTPDISAASESVFLFALSLLSKIGQDQVTPMTLFLSLSIVDGPVKELFEGFGVDGRQLEAAVRWCISGGRDTDVDLSYPTLNLFATDMVRAARKKRISAVIGRDQEILEVFEVLSRVSKNTPILVGEPGTGKTAIVEGVAHRIANGEVPADLKNIKLFSLDLAGLVSGTGGHGELEKRVHDLVAEMASSKDMVLFIDEIHSLMGVRGAGGGLDVANILKPALARGDIRIIGATTPSEYRALENDPAFERRMNKVPVSELTAEATKELLHLMRKGREMHYGIQMSEDALDECVDLSVRYLKSKFLPDKAIDLLDRASAHMKLSNGKRLGVEDVRSALERLTGIPVAKMSESEVCRIAGIENTLKQEVIGQDAAIEAVARVVKRNRAGLSAPHRPVGSFLFFGPSGVGKTQLAKSLAGFLFGESDKMIRFDMSEYQDKYSAARFYGAAPGYVGYENGGQLTEAVRLKPYSVVLFDEIEKAHPDVLMPLLQVLDDGRMTDGQGKTIDFENTIIVMTTNLSAEGIRQRLVPEFINRIDEIIAFNDLPREVLKQIVRNQLDVLVRRLADEHRITMTYDADVVNFVVSASEREHGHGARPIARVIDRQVVSILADRITNGVAGGRIAIFAGASGIQMKG